nr:IMEF encapsulin system ferritin-like cargo protein [Bacillus benzoevorans]
MDEIFKRTKDALGEFMGMITPIMETSTDDHERLYWHHIYEEEEHRSDRLAILMPKIQSILNTGGEVPDNQLEFVHLLQDISLEKFGLHNFLEHLDLSLFQFKGTEFEAKVQELRDFTFTDYQMMKEILNALNGSFHGAAPLQTAIPTDEKDGHGAVKIDAYSGGDEPAQQHVSTSRPKKGLTVGSLKHG